MSRKKGPRSILRELVDQVDPEAFKADPKAALLDAALLVRRAGLEHLVGTATLLEVQALALAGEHLQKEQLVDLTRALADPLAAISDVDGGKTRQEALADAVCARVAARERGQREV